MRIPADLLNKWIAETSTLALDQDRYEHIAQSAAEWARPSRDYLTSICLVGLEPELLNPLLRANVRTVEQVRELGAQRLLMIRGLGPDRIGRILAALNRYDRENA